MIWVQTAVYPTFSEWRVFIQYLLCGRGCELQYESNMHFYTLLFVPPL